MMGNGTRDLTNIFCYVNTPQNLFHCFSNRNQKIYVITNANIAGTALPKKYGSISCPILGSTADNWDQNN